GYTSVQVNINAMGMNILNDAANEPSITIDPTNPNRMAIGWRQFDTITDSFRQAGYAYTTDGGETWTFPGVIEPGIFRSDPVLAADAQGNFYYNSLRVENGSDFFCDVFRSTDGGVTWGSGTLAFGGDKQWMAIDRTSGKGAGHIYTSWNASFSCCGGDFSHSTDGNQSYLGPLTLPDSPFWGTLDVGPDGDLYISGNGFVVLRSINAQDDMETPSFTVSNVNLDGTLRVATGPNPAGLLGQGWVATDHSNTPSRGNVYLLGSVDRFGPDPLDVMFSRSTDNGQTWSPPVQVNEDALNGWQWLSTMSVAPNGRIDVIFLDTKNSGLENVSEMFYTFSIDTGNTWAEAIAVTPQFDSHVGWPQQNKMGDYFDMISDDEGVNIAYAATFNGEQDVYFLRIDGDCNENGVLDLQDIADGSLEDLNQNGQPDSCENASIPTTSSWGVVIMALVMFAMVSVIRRPETPLA
ncbi:MAG: sialidase family protein, partial [Phycisphaerae bacterium]